MAPTRPSIMSLGATMSAPASTCETAVRASSSRLWSLCTSPSTSTPQCPCDVYSQRQTSVMSTSSGKRGRSTRSARCTIPSSSQAPVACSSFSSGSPKRITAWTPSRTRSSTSRTTSSTVYRAIPGSSLCRSDSGATKSGITNWSRLSRVSRTRARSVGFRRKRRSRTSGKSAMPKEYAVLRGQPPHAQASQYPQDRTETQQPQRLDAERSPRARVVQRSAEPAHGMRKGQEVAHPPRKRKRSARDEAEEHDRQHDEHREERGCPRLARERAEQCARSADDARGERDADEEQWQSCPRLTAGDSAGLGN